MTEPGRAEACSFFLMHSVLNAVESQVFLPCYQLSHLQLFFFIVIIGGADDLAVGFDWWQFESIKRLLILLINRHDLATILQRVVQPPPGVIIRRLVQWVLAQYLGVAAS